MIVVGLKQDRETAGTYRLAASEDDAPLTTLYVGKGQFTRPPGADAFVFYFGIDGEFADTEMASEVVVDASMTINKVTPGTFRFGPIEDASGLGSVYLRKGGFDVPPSENQAFRAVVVRVA